MPVKRPVCLICLIFLFVILIATGGKGPKPSWDVDKADGITVSVTGRIADRQEKNDSIQIFIKDVAFKTDQAYFPKSTKGLVIKLADGGINDEMIRMGSMVEARGIFAPFELPRCEGMFDSRQYYLIRGYEGQLKRARLTGISRSYDHIGEALRRIRDRAYSVFLDNMSEDDAGLVAAMTLGDKTGLETDIKELYQRVGISHVLALSGLHIASVGLALLALLKKIHLPQPICNLSAFSLIAAYAVMTGMSTSTIRAMIMFGLFVASSLLGRTYDLLSAAALSALTIVVINPYCIYDTGFLLSFGAVCGIACVFPILSEFPKVISRYFSQKSGSTDASALFGRNDITGRRKSRGIMMKLYQSACITLSITVVTLPVVGKSFMQLSIYSFVINLIVIPLMGLVLATGFGAVFVGFLGIDPGAVLRITHYILWFFGALGNFFEKIPGNLAIIGQPSEWQIITYAIIVVLALITWNARIGDPDLITRLHNYVDRTGRRIPSGSGSYLKKTDNKITYITESASDRIVKSRRDLLVSFITVVMIIVSALLLTLHPRRELEIRNIDVGQGDCALISGNGLPVFLIDGGSSDIKQVSKNRITPVLKANRFRTIDWCFLTHMDSDHVSGVIEILEDEVCGIKIKNVVVSAAAVPSSASKIEDNGNYARLNNIAQKRGVRILVMSAGDCLTFDGAEKKKLRLECLSPKAYANKDMGPSGGTDANDGSLVLKLEYGDFTGLFTGDISENVEEAILANIPDCDYLKVAHHGSKYSSSAAFLKKAMPEMSVISAGVNNSYGHPHSEVIDRLHGCKTKVFCTQNCGEIITFVNGKELSVRKILSK